MRYTVHPLRLAEVNLAGKYNPPTFADVRIPVYGFLILDGANAVLVDTGVGSGHAYIERNFAPEIFPIADALAEVGVTPDDVAFVVNSHLHFDHCGNNRLFKHARFFAQQTELSVARAGQYTIEAWFDFPGAQIVAVDGDAELVEGIQLLATPGHTPGHQSVLVNTEQGQELIVAQAAFSGDEFARGGDPEVQAHEGLAAEYVSSIRRLQALNVGRTYFSHES